jgi:hypothetical protein
VFAELARPAAEASGDAAGAVAAINAARIAALADPEGEALDLALTARQPIAEAGPETAAAAE